MKPRSKKCCFREPSPKEMALSEAGYDDIEEAILTIARYYFQTFALPQTQSWLAALQVADTRFPGTSSAGIAMDILAAVQAMRMSRSSPFRFSNPACPGCSQIIGEHERQFMCVVQAARRGQMGSARTHAMLLCEGNDTEALIARMVALAASTAAASDTRAKTAASPHLV